MGQTYEYRRKTTYGMLEKTLINALNDLAILSSDIVGLCVLTNARPLKHDKAEPHVGVGSKRVSASRTSRPQTSH